MTTGQGERQYELVRGWGQLPAGWAWGQVGGVAVDSQDRVHAFSRGSHPYMIFDRDGRLVDHWGEGIFEDAHGICITPDDTVYFVDRDPQVVITFTREGRHRLTLGNRHVHSETGYTVESPTVTHAGDPFHHPTDVSVSADGHIYVSDGYRNCRVHKYASDGTLLLSWGEPGDGPGQFVLPHSVWEHRGRVYVADRGNNRIQVFNTDGKYLREFTIDVPVDTTRGKIVFGAETPNAKTGSQAPGAPDALCMTPGPNPVLFVGDLYPSRIYKVSLEGKLLGVYGQPGRNLGEFGWIHAIACPSENEIWVAELINWRVQKLVTKKK